MTLAFLNLFISIIITSYFGFTALHCGFFKPLIASDGAMVRNYSFNFLCSPMFWIVILDFIFIISLLITSSKLSDKTKRAINILAPIWTIITIVISLGLYLYN